MASRNNERERTRWNNDMVNDLLECKKIGISINSSADSPRKPNGRKVAYMELMLQEWNARGYTHLGLTAQNL